MYDYFSITYSTRSVCQWLVLYKALGDIGSNEGCYVIRPIHLIVHLLVYGMKCPEIAPTGFLC